MNVFTINFQLFNGSKSLYVHTYSKYIHSRVHSTDVQSQYNIICPCIITCTLIVFSTRSYAIVVIEHAHGKTTIFSYTKPMITKYNKRYQFSLISFCSTVLIFKSLVRQLKKWCIIEDKLLKLISENILCAEIHCKTWYLYAMHMTFYYDVNFNQIYSIHVYV